MSMPIHNIFSMPSWTTKFPHEYVKKSPPRSSESVNKSSSRMPSYAEIEAERVSLRILDELTPYVQAYPHQQTCENLKRQWGISGELINMRFSWLCKEM